MRLKIAPITRYWARPTRRRDSSPLVLRLVGKTGCQSASFSVLQAAPKFALLSLRPLLRDARGSHPSGGERRDGASLIIFQTCASDSAFFVPLVELLVLLLFSHSSPNFPRVAPPSSQLGTRITSQRESMGYQMEISAFGIYIVSYSQLCQYVRIENVRGIIGGTRIS